MPLKFESRPTKAKASLETAHIHLVANGNPLKADPTRTTMIRRAFMADIKRRMRKLKESIKQFLVTDDQLGLVQKKSFVLMVRDFQFRTDAGKLQAFNEWFRQQVEADAFSVPPGTPPDKLWTAKYVDSSYKMGQTNAYFASRRAASDQEEFFDQSLEQFLRTSFAQPEAISKLQLLATRVFEQLRGVTASMGAEMNRILAQGIADGSGAIEIAREMAARIDSLTEARALLIARTEVINAHAEGQLDAFEQLGVEEVGLLAEWATAGDDRVCPLCADREGQVFSVEEARGQIPLHPNCRCAWLPVISPPRRSR